MAEVPLHGGYPLGMVISVAPPGLPVRGSAGIPAFHAGLLSGRPPGTGKHGQTPTAAGPAQAPRRGVCVAWAGGGGAEGPEAEKAGWGTRTGGRATSGTRVPDGRRGRRPLHEDVRHPDESGHAQTGRYKDRSLTVAALIARRAAGRYNLTG